MLGVAVLVLGVGEANVGIEARRITVAGADAGEAKRCCHYFIG